MVVAVILAVVLGRPGGDTATAGEVILQPTDDAGVDPYTPSTANTTTALPAAAPSTAPAKKDTISSVAGSEPGLYGGSRNTASCDVEKQIRYLSADPARNRAFASVVGVQESTVPAYLRSLTPVQLRSDTRVTNHGFRDGVATSYQSVLQAGTAVLVDKYGEPKVRCACGNPLSRVVPQPGTPRQKGPSWPGYQPQNVVVVNRSTTVINVFVIYDSRDKQWVHRYTGDQVHHDKPAPPPPRHWPTSPPSPPVTHTPGTRPPTGTESPVTKPPTGTPTNTPTNTQSPATRTPGPKTPTETPTGATPSPATETPATPTPTPTPTTEATPTPTPTPTKETETPAVTPTPTPTLPAPTPTETPATGRTATQAPTTQPPEKPPAPPPTPTQAPVTPPPPTRAPETERPYTQAPAPQTEAPDQQNQNRNHNQQNNQNNQQNDNRQNQNQNQNNQPGY
ncbi:DUF6777 domain-containing protein [Streptomyces sp. NPDC000075]|uniref:DUF6777 domain-containing protein n=1 Tax=Streptomyces sp. NPDC000075 TaxID=3154241 RepID=UPI0031D01BFC